MFTTEITKLLIICGTLITFYLYFLEIRRSFSIAKSIPHPVELCGRTKSERNKRKRKRKQKRKAQKTKKCLHAKEMRAIIDV